MKPGEPQVTTMLSFEQALSEVETRVTAAGITPAIEVVPLGKAWGRVLAEEVKADRDYPPFNRSTRDGFAVRSQDVKSVNTVLTLDGEVRAGEYFKEEVAPGHCVTIMTGAPLPAGTDAVVMVEYTRTLGDKVEIQRPVTSFENVVRKATECDSFPTGPNCQRVVTLSEKLTQKTHLGSH